MRSGAEEAESEVVIEVEELGRIGQVDMAAAAIEKLAFHTLLELDFEDVVEVDIGDGTSYYTLGEWLGAAVRRPSSPKSLNCG